MNSTKGAGKRGKRVGNVEEKNAKTVIRLRRAQEKDIKGIGRLLLQVNALHHEGRADLFKAGARKYSDAQLKEILKEEKTPVFVAVTDIGEVEGYAFCIFQSHPDDSILTDVKTLYIDDLCVDENTRGKGIGTQLFSFVSDFARERGCYNLTLNVWSCNPAALRFYKRCGLKPQKIGLEKIFK